MMIALSSVRDATEKRTLHITAFVGAVLGWMHQLNHIGFASKNTTVGPCHDGKSNQRVGTTLFNGRISNSQAGWTDSGWHYCRINESLNGLKITEKLKFRIKM